MTEEKNNKLITIFLGMLIFISAITIIYVNLPSDNETDDDTTDDTDDETPEEEETPSEEDETEPAVLTIVYGLETNNYTLEQLEAMDTITGYAGKRTDFPAINGQGIYTGVKVTDLVEATAGDIDNYSVIVTSDEEGTIENQTYNYSMVQGNVNIYNSTNASDSTPIQIGGVTMIVCFQQDGEYLDPSDDGILRIVYINTEEELITKSGLWWKFVVKIEIAE